MKRMVAIFSILLTILGVNASADCYDCNCQPCICEAPCAQPCDPCNPRGPVCGTDCGMSLVAIGIGIAAVAAAAAIIATSGNGGDPDGDGGGSLGETIHGHGHS